MLGMLHGGQATRYWGMFQMPTTNGPQSANGSSDTMWQTFNFAADFKAPIDAIKAAGGNLMVGFLAAESVAGGFMTQNQFNTNLRQVMDYAAASGIYYLPYASHTQSQWPGGVTLTGVGDFIASVCGVLGGYPNLRGFVTQDEPIQGSSATSMELTSVSTLYPYARNNLPANIPVCACPNPQGNANTVGSYTGPAKTNTDNVAQYCDFLAYHPFIQISPSNFTDVQTAYPNKLIRFLSAVDTAFNSGSLSNIVNSIMGQTRKNQFDTFGWFATVDLNSGDNTGFFDFSYVPHAAALTLFQANM